MSENNKPLTPKKANRWLLYGPLIGGGVLFALYTVFWFIGSNIMKEQIDLWVEGEKERGMIVTHGAVDIQGYPFVLRAKIEEPTYASPRDGWQWQSDRLYIDTLPLNPTKLILSPNGQQRIDVNQGSGTESWLVNADVVRASLSQTKMAFEFHKVKATPANGSNSSLREVVINSFKANTLLEGKAPEDIGYFAMKGDGIQFIDEQSENNLYINFIDSGIRASAFSLFSAAHNGDISFDAWRDQDGTFEIEGFRLSVTDALETEPTHLAVTGLVNLDQRNYPAGDIEIKIANPDTLLTIAKAKLQEAGQDTSSISTAQTFLSRMGSSEITLPIKLEKGKAKIATPLGSMSLADLPRLP